jgi:predicted GIY-YIG superfamily endonuclease
MKITFEVMARKVRQMSTSKKVWTVYLIFTGNRTYVGATTDPTRRLRQHNREILGGARATHKGAGTWKFAMYLTGFVGRSEAYRWEALVKKRARGVVARSQAIVDISQGICPGVDRGKRSYTPPKKLQLVTMGYTV